MGGLLANVRCFLGICPYSPALLLHRARRRRGFDQMATSGWRYTVCTEPKTINLVNTDLDVWACFFVLSKIFEFFDTILKILLKKQFIFLHWYHHLATAYLCWLSLAYNFAPVRILSPACDWLTAISNCTLRECLLLTRCMDVILLAGRLVRHNSARRMLTPLITILA